MTSSNQATSTENQERPTITREQYEKTIAQLMRRFISLADRNIKDDNDFLEIASECVEIARAPYPLADEKQEEGRA